MSPQGFNLGNHNPRHIKNDPNDETQRAWHLSLFVILSAAKNLLLKLLICQEPKSRIATKDNTD
jgi:hypothetical protein